MGIVHARWVGVAMPSRLPDGEQGSQEHWMGERDQHGSSLQETKRVGQEAGHITQYPRFAELS